MSSITMSAAVERGMRSASVEFALEVIGELSRGGVLECSLDDAIKMFDFGSVAVVSSRSKASKKRESGKKVSKITAKPTVVLPFCGKIQADWCKGVKFNHGLHTQCTTRPSGDDTYCKTCRKHADNSATGKPPYGDINDRAEFNVDYRDPKGKLTMPYANVVEKLSINLETANAAAATLGWTIPAEQLVKRTSKRGRPAKSAAVSDSDSDEETPKKKRGRPSKAKVVLPTQEDQIAQLVAEAYAETTTKPVLKIKVKRIKLTTEQKDQAKIAKKEVADKLKAEKKEAADKLKAEKKEAADKLKAEKAAANLAKKESSDKLKEEKLVAKALEKEAKDAAAAKVKAEKKAIALKARQEKAAAKKAEKDAAKLRKKEAALKLKAEKAETSDDSSPEDVIVLPELEEEKIAEIDSSDDEEIADIDSSDDEEEPSTELSELMTVGGVEYFFSDYDGQTVLFSKVGVPVGVYDAETDTVQEAEFDDE